MTSVSVLATAPRTVLTRVAGSVSLWNRTRKMSLFHETMRPDASTSVIDVGVGDTGFSTEPGVARTHNFFEAMYPWPEQITAVSDRPLPQFSREFPTVRCVVADGKRLPFPDDSFDVAFSNAVLEHVGGQEEQRRFVHELCRVAPRVFISTPNRLFPIEPHTLLPLAHWLPRGPRDWIFTRLKQDFWTHLDLLTPHRLLALFPSTTRARIVESRITITATATRS